MIEIALLQPRVIVALSSTAAQSLVGPHVRVLRDRGTPIDSPLALYVVVHPSALLREPDDAAREAVFSAFVDDLRCAARD